MVRGRRSLADPTFHRPFSTMLISCVRRRPLSLASLVTLFACSGPTDLSPGIWVTIESATPVLLRGAQAAVLARVWRPGANGDSVELHNVTLLWASADTRIATVESGAQGRGRITGVNSGYVEIRATVPSYENAAPAVLSLRVANPLEIDSITPDTVRYGDRVTMYGIGVGDLFFVGLGSGFLISDSLSIAGDKSGLGRQSFWVPWPSLTGNIFAAGSGQLIAAADTTVVVPWDLYEPNEVAPTDVPLDGADPFAIPALRFFNPALAFEDRRDFPFGFDWYRLRATNLDAPYTIVFSAPAQAGAHATYLTDRLRSGGGTDTTEWKLGSGEYTCKGYPFRPEEALSDSVIIALARLPASSIDFVSGFVQEGRYLLGIVQGYATADPRLAPDAYEENDLCIFADDNFAPGRASRIDLGVKSFGENLTIDNAHDIDWLRFRVPGLTPQPVAIRTAGQPFTVVDRSDIDVYVMTVPSSSQGLSLAGRDVSRGSTSSLDLLLAPGDYYLAVVDSAGVPTRYSLCIAIGTTCALTSPPAPSVVAAREAQVLRPLAPYLARPRRERAVAPERR